MVTEASIIALADAAADDPGKFGPYLTFLMVANRAAREADPDQRHAIRALTGLHLLPEQYTPLIEKIMGWD